MRDNYNWEDINSYIDKFFPFKDDSGRPVFRKHQRETIEKILRSFLIDEKKFVAVDGPVGCGKSVINYTVAMVIGKTIYLTPLKMLQDQIGLEKWDCVRVLKGKSSYGCNYAGYDDPKIRCDYSDDIISTCNNSRELNMYSDRTMGKIKRKVTQVFDMFKNDTFTRTLRSSFNSPNEISTVYEQAKEMLMCQKESIAKANNDFDPRKVKYDFDVEKNIACSMDDSHECPSKTSKLLARLANIRVLNPDIFYLLNLGRGTSYSVNDLIIYDECQQIEGVVGRIFKNKIPIDTLKRLFGIDLTHLYNLDELDGLLDSTIHSIKCTLGPSLASCKMIDKLGEICAVRNFPTLERLRSRSWLATVFKTSYNNLLFNKWKEDRSFNLSVLRIVDYVMMGVDVPIELGGQTDFTELVSFIYDGFFNKYSCSKPVSIFENLIPACKRKFNGDILYRNKISRTHKLKRNELDNWKYEDIVVSEDLIFAGNMTLFCKSTEEFINSFLSLMNVKNKKDKPCFTISKSIETTDEACRNNYYLKKEIMNTRFQYNKEKCLEIIPIDVGKIMSYFFYSKASKVLLTSGTWVNPDKLYEIYGINKNSVEFIKIPSTFNINYRPIYVLANRGFTDFSAKDSGNGKYIYNSERGSKKFTMEVSSIVKRLRTFIKRSHNVNPNIIIHCHKFDIARMIALLSPDINEKYLIHLPSSLPYVDNKITGYRVWGTDKNDLIQKMRENPSSGLTIISPSISEGVDFKGDIARGQILLKKPIPYLGDVYVKSFYKGNPEIGIPQDRDFLDRMCYTTISQQYGRIVRSDTDWGYTIVMDQALSNSLKYLIKQGDKRVRDLNIEYFFEGLKYDLDSRGFPIFKWIFG